LNKRLSSVLARDQQHATLTPMFPQLRRDVTSVSRFAALLMTLVRTSIGTDV